MRAAGADDSLRARTRLALRRAPRLVPLAALLVLIAVGSGAWYFYNAHVLNEYLTAKDRRAIQAGYERDFKKYELLPQPKVTAVDANDQHLSRSAVHSKVPARFTLQNKSAVPISQIHLTDEQRSVSNVQFDRPFHLVSRARAISTPSMRSTGRSAPGRGSYPHVLAGARHARLPRWQ